jgi:hypothetical protein
MAESYVRTATSIDAMSEREFLERFGEVSRIVGAIPGDPSQNARAVFSLHKRHAAAVTHVIDGELAKHAKDIREGLLPETSLLMLSVHGKYRVNLAPGDEVKSAKSSRPQLPPEEQRTREQALALADRLPGICPGNDSASEYHEFMMKAIEVLFCPSLAKPKKEVEILSGQKRIDIVCRNTREDSFFSDLREVYSIHCPFIMIECKNYKDDPGNPELDQLVGRFGGDCQGRGKFGMLMCRSIADRDRAIERCRGVQRDRKGYVLMFDDGQLIELLQMRSKGGFHEMRESLNGAIEPLFL